MTAGLFLYLAWNAWMDGRTRRIDLRVTALYLLFFAASCLLGRTSCYPAGLVPGLLLYLASRIGGGQVGGGDGILLMAVGLTLGLDLTVRILYTGCILVCVWSFSRRLLARKSVSRAPFVPFLLAAYFLEVGL